MKRIIILCSVVFFMASCGGSGTNDQSSGTKTTAQEGEAGTQPEEPEVAYDTARGAGKFHDVQLSKNLDKPMANAGEKIYEMKCQGCHKLTAERLVGPGWKGMTSTHHPAWIMNFVTNTDEMIDKDPKAQAMLDICMVRMPNQNLSDQDARDILEFMRENDGVK